MIKIDISTALFFYMLFSTMLILVVWGFFDFGTKLKIFGSDEKYIWHCSICANTYIDSRHSDISRCPVCGSYNEKIINKDLPEKT